MVVFPGRGPHHYLRDHHRRGVPRPAGGGGGQHELPDELGHRHAQGRQGIAAGEHLHQGIKDQVGMSMKVSDTPEKSSLNLALSVP